MLVTSIFSLSLHFFTKHLSKGHLKDTFCGKGMIYVTYSNTSVPKDKIVDWPMLETLADNNLNITKCL